MNQEERDLWKAVYIASIRAGMAYYTAYENANNAVRNFKEADYK